MCYKVARHCKEWPTRKLHSQTARLQIVSTGTAFLRSLAEDEGAPSEELTKRVPPCFFVEGCYWANRGAQVRAQKEDGNKESVENMDVV